MNNTRTVEVNIQAVSPESSFGASSAQTIPDNMKKLKTINKTKLIFLCFIASSS
ncbi:MAG TPA: hypothetical protein QF468_02870 [Nitrospinota bacterium]|nr:hypothetical protein [Nitrospinota bacterium]